MAKGRQNSMEPGLFKHFPPTISQLFHPPETRPASPIHRHGQLLSEAVVIVDLAVLEAVFVDEPRQLHIVGSGNRGLDMGYQMRLVWCTNLCR